MIFPAAARLLPAPMVLTGVFITVRTFMMPSLKRPWDCPRSACGLPDPDTSKRAPPDLIQMEVSLFAASADTRSLENCVPPRIRRKGESDEHSSEDHLSRHRAF